MIIKPVHIETTDKGYVLVDQAGQHVAVRGGVNRQPVERAGVPAGRGHVWFFRDHAEAEARYLNRFVTDERRAA